MTAPELLLKAAKELAEYASYAEIAGGVSVNRPQVRRWCDAVFDIIRALPKDEWGEPTLASSPEVAALIAEARREERERAAGIAAVKMTEWARATYQNPDARMQNAAKVYAAGEIITAIRALKEETP